MEDIITFGWPYVDYIILAIVFICFLVLAIWGINDDNK